MESEVVSIMEIVCWKSWVFSYYSCSPETRAEHLKWNDIKQQTDSLCEVPVTT